jgi:transcriptional regulator with XRE-family HTH domain
MFQVGSTLRQARLRQGLELAEIEARLHIRSKYLAALEEERFELLPGAAYVRGFLRAYADFLGLDSSRLLDEYEDRFPRAEQPEQLPPRPTLPRWQAPIGPRFGVSILVAFLALAGLLILGLSRGPGTHPRPTAARGLSPAPARRQRTPLSHPRLSPPAVRPMLSVSLRGSGAWDPYGDRREHDTEAAAASDGNPSTYWRTESYLAGLQKAGVGLVLEAQKAVALTRLTLTTDTPGYTALIEAGPAAAGPFQAVAGARTVAATTTFLLHSPAARYYVVWITKLDQVAHVNEVRAFA